MSVYLFVQSKKKATSEPLTDAGRTIAWFASGGRRGSNRRKVTGAYLFGSWAREAKEVAVCVWRWSRRRCRCCAEMVCVSGTGACAFACSAAAAADAAATTAAATAAAAAIDIHTYKQHKLQRRIQGAESRLRFVLASRRLQRPFLRNNTTNSCSF